MKILLIRFSSIGDIVLTTPIIRCTKNRYPNAKLHFLTKSKFKSILEANPYIDEIKTLDGDIQPLLLDLLKEKYDVVIDLHKNIRTFYVTSILKQAFNSQVQVFRSKKMHFKKWLFVNLKINTLPDKSIVDRYFEGVKKLNIANDGKGLDYFISADDEIKKDDLPTSHMLGFVACSIGGQHATKKMPLAKWEQLCHDMEYPLVLLGGQEDFEMGEKIKAMDPVKIYNACGKYSLNESAHIISKAKVVVSHDTGLMHIAAAYKKPIVSIWGSTTPYFGMFPYYGFNNIKTHIASSSTLIENPIKCRPCSKIGHNQCPKKHFKCMEGVDISTIQAAVNQHLGN